jgi:hypothetical protein
MNQCTVRLGQLKTAVEEIEAPRVTEDVCLRRNKKNRTLWHPFVHKVDPTPLRHHDRKGERWKGKSLVRRCPRSEASLSGRQKV